MIEVKHDFLGLKKGHIYKQAQEDKELTFVDIQDSSNRVSFNADRLWRVSDLFDEIEETDGM